MSADPSPPPCVPGAERSGRSLLLAAALVSGAIGAVTLLGWVLGSARWTGATADWPSVKVHAAVGFLVVSVALWADGPRGRWVRQGAAALLVVLAGLALLELFLPTGTRLSAWPTSWSLDDGSVSEPMAANAAAAFLALAAALWGLRGPRPRLPVVALGASLAGAIAAAAGLGYLLDIASVRGWNLTDAMAVPATMGFLVVAGALLQVSWKRDPSQLGPPGWLPIPVAVLGLGTILLVWQIAIEAPGDLAGRASVSPARFAQISSALASAVAIGLALYAWQHAARTSRHLAIAADELRAERDRRAASQRELEVARTALAAVVEQAPVGIVQLAPGEAVAANAEAVRLLGAQAEARARLEALTPLDGTPELPDLLEEVAADGRHRSGRYRSPEAGVVDVRVVGIRPGGDEDGQPARILALLVDVTLDHDARRHLAAALEREQTAVEELRRLDELKDVFLSAVSHELRTPLTVMSGSVETLRTLGSALDAAERDVLVAAVARNAERLTDLLTDLLDLDRIRRQLLHPVRASVDLGELARAAVSEMDLGARRVVLDDPGGVLVPADPTMVTRIVVNLVNNALRHTEGPAPIVVRLSYPRPDVARIEVEDDGPGVSESDKLRIFDAFEQGTTGLAGVSGIGIGLNLVLRFARLHDGRAWVEDVPGGGARFVVELVAPRRAVERLVPFEQAGSPGTVGSE